MVSMSAMHTHVTLQCVYESGVNAPFLGLWKQHTYIMPTCVGFNKEAFGYRWDGKEYPVGAAHQQAAQSGGHIRQPDIQPSRQSFSPLTVTSGNHQKPTTNQRPTPGTRLITHVCCLCDVYSNFIIVLILIEFHAMSVNLNSM